MYNTVEFVGEPYTFLMIPFIASFEPNTKAIMPKITMMMFLKIIQLHGPKPLSQ